MLSAPGWIVFLVSSSYLVSRFIFHLDFLWVFHFFPFWFCLLWVFFRRLHHARFLPFPSRFLRILWPFLFCVYCILLCTACPPTTFLTFGSICDVCTLSFVACCAAHRVAIKVTAVLDLVANIDTDTPAYFTLHSYP